MKIACTGDWHIHQFQDFSKQLAVEWDNSSRRFVKNLYGKEMNSRLFNILNGICDLRDYCRDNGIEYVLNAGDIFHKRGNINVETFNAAYKVIESFRNCGIEMISIAGNHDQVDSSENPSTSIHTLKKICTVIEKPIECFFTPRLRVCCIPYNRDKEKILSSLNNFLQRENPSTSILLVHLGVSGAVVGSGMYVMSDEYSLDELYANKFKYVVMGHYHRPQLLSKNVFYCGTPVQNSFNDELPTEENGGYNGFFVIDTEKRYDVQFVPIVQPRFITVKSKLEIPEGSPNYYRIRANSKEVEKINVEELGENVRIELEKDYSEIQRSEIGIADDFQMAIKKYVKEKSPNSPELADLGLEILSEVMMGGK